MSNYDAWKTESGDDYEFRMHMHDRGPLVTDEGGICACGTVTERSVAGVGWQCRSCGEAAMQRQFTAPPSICCAVYAAVVDPDGPIYRCPLCHKSFLMQKDAAIR